VLRRLIWAAAFVISLPVVFYLAALLGAVLPGQHSDLAQGSDQSIGLVRGPIHYDLLLPMTPETRAQFGFAEASGVPLSNPNVEWLIVGWGSRAFYTNTATLADMKASIIWQAVSGDSAVLHLDVAGNLAGVEGVTYLPLSQVQMTALLGAIEATFLRDQTGQPVALPEHFSSNDAFFAAKGHFSLFRTCNVWIGELLRRAGLRFGIWTPTPQAVELSLAWFDQS
jgi:uncharacterized protein (TIGR02117 family)